MFNFNDNNPDYFYGSYFGASIYGLSSNKNTVWSIALIENYIDKWNWEELSGNINLPWTLELIEKYNNKWDWNNLSCNSRLPWSEDLIQKYEDKWNWSLLSANKSIPWSLFLINKYLIKVENDEQVWNQVKNYIDDEFIDKVLNIAENK